MKKATMAKKDIQAIKARDRNTYFSPDPKLDKKIWGCVLKGKMPVRLVPDMESHGYICKLAEDEYDITFRALCWLKTVYPSLFRRVRRTLRRAEASRTSEVRWAKAPRSVLAKCPFKDGDFPD